MMRPNPIPGGLPPLIAVACTLCTSSIVAQEGADACQYQEPVWHPDGTRVEFSSNRDGEFERYAVDVDGGSLRRLLPDGWGGGPADWSGDGRRVAFASSREGSGAIYVTDAGFGDPRRVTPPEIAASAPAWSPDGARIAFEGRRDGNTDIYAISADGSGLVRLTSHEGNDFRPSWSPDGERIAFGSNRSGRYELYVMSSGGEDARPLTEGPGNSVDPRWSPDGGSILFMSDRSGDEEVYAMAADGSRVERLTDHAGLDYAADWSPDGRRIAFVSVDEGRYGIWTMSFDGSGRRLVIDGCTDWHDDVDYLTAVLPRVHADLYHTVSPEEFAEAARELADRIDGLHDAVARAELAGLVAMVGDGHTRVNLLRPGAPGVPSDPGSGFVPLPVELYAFADGLHVRSAAPDHADLVGARVVTIGSVPATDAFDRVRRFMHRDNEMTVRLGVPWLLVRPAFLRAAGVIEGLASIPMELETPTGVRVRRELRPAMDADAGAVDAFDGRIAERPLWLRDNDRPYWYVDLPDERAVYVQFNAVIDAEDESLASFAVRLRERLGAGDVERVIVDLRHNDGGNFVLALPLVDVLDTFEASRGGRGSLFVLTGRATFSAAGVFAALLEARTEAVFAGEPTAARPNTYGDLDSFTLPASGLEVAYSTRYFQPAGPYDERPWIAPEITAELTFEDYARGRDPVLEAVLAYRAEEPLRDRMLEAARTGSVEAALDRYREFVARPDGRYYWAFDDLVALGVHYWREGALETSLAVWRELARDYPDSAEGHENLAETYQALDDRASAIDELLASLQVDARNPDAVELVAELCGADAVRRMMEIDLTSGAGLARLGEACGIAPSEDDPATEPPAATGSPVEVALEPYVGRLVTVDGEIGGHPARLILDTGGGATSVTPSIARQIGCEPSGRSVGYRMDGERVDFAYCPASELKIAGVTIRNDRVAVFDLQALLPEDFPRVDGVLSLDAFSARPFTLQLAERRLTLETPESARQRIEGMTRLRSRVATGTDGDELTVFVRVGVDGTGGWFLVDSANLDVVQAASHMASSHTDSEETWEAELTFGDLVFGPAAFRTRDLIYDGALSESVIRRWTWTFDLSQDAVWVEAGGSGPADAGAGKAVG
ncbi:MAG: aspartyl protease family protein [Gemmatimonadota bacterium]|nr:aspartyl protease family protein [Gemmatimonadota bacterium]